MKKKLRARRTKENIVWSVSTDTGYSLPEVEAIINSVLDNIIFEVSHDREVRFAGFGTFEPKERAARTGRNPHTKEPVPIPARVIPSFEAGERFKNAVVRELPTKKK